MVWVEQKNFHKIIIAIFLAIAFIVLTVQLKSLSAREIVGEGSGAAILTVIGEGVVTAIPDMARIQVGVITHADTAHEALKANAQSTNNVIEAFQKEKVESRDLATSGFSVKPRYTNPKNNSGEAPRIDGYEVRNLLTVRIHDLAQLGTLLDVAITSGSNRIDSISFNIQDEAALLDKARANAVLDARRKAEILAKTAGVKLGRITTINGESYGGSQPRNIMMQASADMFSARAAVPIKVGEQEFRATISITWELVN